MLFCMYHVVNTQFEILKNSGVYDQLNTRIKGFHHIHFILSVLISTFPLWQQYDNSSGKVRKFCEHLFYKIRLLYETSWENGY